LGCPDKEVIPIIEVQMREVPLYKGFGILLKTVKSANEVLAANVSAF